MPEEKRKIPRLGKAAGEFNVSISTITTLLKKKNLEIEENPNAKLSEERSAMARAWTSRGPTCTSWYR